jgi:hypothetical protein
MGTPPRSEYRLSNGWLARTFDQAPALDGWLGVDSRQKDALLGSTWRETLH